MVEKIVDGIWTVRAPFSILGLPLGCRATIVRLKDGRLWVHSPIAFSEEDTEEIAKLGEVAYVVAPNLFHHLYLRPALEKFPSARLWGPEGLKKKRKNLEFDGILNQQPHPWQGDLIAFSPPGQPKFQETAFYHPQTKSLIVADLFFNLSQFPNLPSKILSSLFGTRNGFAVSRLFRLMVKDPKGFSQSLAPLLDRPIERIILSHGDIWEGPQEKIQQALRKRGLGPKTLPQEK